MNKRKSFQVKCDINEKKIFNNFIIRKSKKQTGITLIALVISIIVMLILAGVSLNATIGENGIITQAQNAKYIQNCAELEEFFNQYYVQHYDELDKAKNKVEAIRGMHINWFFSTISDEYITDANGHALYLLKKAEFLKDNPDYKITGGDAGEGTYKDYFNLNDVYGVTSDLKVYYCSNGIDSIYGVDEGSLDKENYSRIIISSDSALSKLINHESSEGVSVSEARSVSELTIDENTGINNLQELYKLPNLEKITIKNLKNNELNLQGIENAVKLKYLCLYNCNLSDYNVISKLTNLNYLYLYKSNDEEVNKICDAMKNTDYTNLKYLGIFGDSNVKESSGSYWYGSGNTEQSDVTSIDGLNKLTDQTKKAVNYLYLNNNKLTSLNSLSEFVNVENLLVNGNLLTSVLGIENMKNLYLLSVQVNKNLNDISAIANLKELKTFVSFSTDLQSIQSLANSTKMSYINLQSNSKILDISPIANMNNLSDVYLAGCNNMTTDSVKSIRYAYNRVSVYSKSIDSKYIPYLETEDTKNLTSNDLTDTILDEKIANMTDITKLNLNYNTNLANTSFNSLSSETQTKILTKLGNNDSSKTNDAYFRYVLSTLENMEYLTIRNISNLKNIDFVKYMPNLRELDLRGTGVTDLSILETLKNSNGNNKLEKLSVLIINNENIDLTKIQNVIQSLYDKGSGAYWSYAGDRNVSGLRIGNGKLLTSLGKCSNITRLKLSFVDDVSTNTFFDLSGMKSLRSYCGIFATYTVKLPYTVTYCYQNHCQYPIFDTSAENPSQLTSFCNNNSSETSQSGLKKMFDSLEYCQTEKEISIDIYSVFSTANLDGIEKMKNCKFSTIYFNPWYAVIDSFDCFSKFTENANGYIKRLSIDGTYYMNSNKCKINNIPDLKILKVNELALTNCGIVDFSGISENTTITSLNLDNNDVQNLEPLLKMKQLQIFSVYKNKIYNSYNDAVNNKKVNNLDILYKINKKIDNQYNVNYVNLKENNLEQTEEFEKVKNSYGDNCYW